MSSEYDEEPRIHTVISPDSSNSNTYFNSIAFSMPRREDVNAAAPATNQPTQGPMYGDDSVRIPTASNYDEMSMSMMADDLQSGDPMLDINNQRNSNEVNQYHGEPQGLPVQQTQDQGFYDPNSQQQQPQYVYDNQNQQVYYDNSNQVPPDYNYLGQPQQAAYESEPSQVMTSYQNQSQVPLDQSLVPESYVNQPQVSYGTHPQIPYDDQQPLVYENQQQTYADPQQMAYTGQMQFPPQDQTYSQVNYDAESQNSYNQSHNYNPNDILYNSQQQQVSYQNESQVGFENQMKPTSLILSPVYADIRQYNETSSNTEANIVSQLENLELGVETGVDVSATPAYGIENQEIAVYYGDNRAAGDIAYQQITPSENQISGEFSPPNVSSTQIDNFSSTPYSLDDCLYDIWIPSEETLIILKNNSEEVRAGTHFPDKAQMTAPGVIYADDLVDKVGVNMARIFGEAEACKRKILTADSVTQDDNGLRELIKLGCYRSAINLTKRLLTLYGQGPGKVGHYSKQTPHSIQLWFTRISLLMRIREFPIAESEIAAFKNFENSDLFYEYYPDTYGRQRTGSMVPFHFRLLAAEIPQYVRKFNETANGLNQILLTIEKIINRIENGESTSDALNTDDNCEGKEETDIQDHSSVKKILDSTDLERKEKSLSIWRKREIRTLYSLLNASLFSKDYYNAFTILIKLCDTDTDHRSQLKSAIGRLFLQHGDLTTAQTYFLEAADLRSGDSEADQVETLIDSALTSIAQNAYPEAFLLFQQAQQIQPENFMVTNNMAVCLLYMGNVKDSLALMESTVKQNTPQLLQENVILNLSTIYELENSDGYKKNALLKLISQYKGDGINLASLKMPNLI